MKVREVPTKRKLTQNISTVPRDVFVHSWFTKRRSII
jgi:hypothetical protein